MSRSESSRRLIMAVPHSPARRPEPGGAATPAAARIPAPACWSLIALLLGAAPAPGAPSGPPDDEPARPNVVIILADDMGWGQPGFNGGTEVATPNLDRIADEGVKLTQFYSQPVCSPTRAALLTGRYAWRTGVVTQVEHTEAGGMLQDERTLAEMLRDAGYATWMVGKWHLGHWQAEHLPLQRGFDHHYGFYGGQVTPRTRMRSGVLDWHRNGRPVVESGYTTLLLAEEAVQLIGRHDGSNPFFLYVGFDAVHTPFDAPQEYLELYRGRENHKQRAMLKTMDVAIGRIMEAIEHKGALDDTLVIFLNDNGGTAEAGGNEPWSGLKRTWREGGVRVPAALRWPGHIPKGSESDALLHVSDLFPTLARLAGASVDAGLPLDGLDAWESIAAGAASPRQEVVFSPTAVRMGDWKLSLGITEYYVHAFDSLYNLRDDPSESRNLVDAEPEKYAELSARLAQAAAALSERPPGTFVAIPGHPPAVYGEHEHNTYGAEVQRTLRLLAENNPGPSLLRTEVSGNRLKLLYDETLDASSVPPASAFTAVVNPGYQPVEVTGVEVAGSEVRLTLAAPVESGETVGLTYEVPATGLIRDADRIPANGVTWITAAPAPAPPLTASFGSVPESHDGETPFAFELRFSEEVAVSYATLRDTAFTVTGGAVRGAQRLAPPSNRGWRITVEPNVTADVVVVLPGTADCAAAGAVCTSGGRPLSHRLEAVVPGPDAADLPVVSVSAVSARVSEAESAQFRLTRTGSTDEELAVAVGGTWSDGTAASVQRPRFLAGRAATTAGFRRTDNEVSGERTLTVRVEEGTGYAVSAAAGSAVVVVEDDDAAVFAVSVEPAEVPAGGTATLRVSIGNGVTFAEAQTLVVEASSASVAMTVQAPRGPGEIGLAAGASAATAELWVVEGAAAEEVVTLTVRHGGAEVGSAELRVSAGAPAPLTGRFEEVPATHDGETAFTFELHFSEEPRLSYLTLRDEAFEVTGGGVERARRLLPPSNLGWEITVAPATTGEVVVLLGATADCAAAGAVCTSGGKKLTGEVTARVRGPASETAGFSLAPENAWPGGLWSDGETAWVADVEDGRVYAYRLADGSRVPERDVAAGGAPVGLWSDGATLWVADAAGVGVAAYRLVDGTRAAARDLAAVSGAPVGVWSDGETAWVAEWLGERVFALRLSDGTRAPERDVLLSGENLLPVGLWSDGATLWVADWGERVFAYRLLDGSRESERDVVLPEGDGDPSGLWSDGEVLLVTGWGGAEVRSRPLPAGLAEGSAAVMSVGGWSAGVPPVADAGLRAALAAALGGSGAGGLAELEVLEARGRGIRSLAGLSGAVRLRELDLGFNPLEEVGALGQLPALVSLNLDGTGLAPGSLGYLPGLEKLSLRGNGLDELGALTLLPGLVELDVGENGLADLGPLAGLRGLRVLRADRNRLADAGPLASVPGLRVADLGRNRLRTLSGLSGAGGLRALRLDGNGALDLTALGGLAGLSELGLAGTGVEELGALSGLTGLVRLDLRGARVRDLGPLRGLAALSWVHVGGSAVEDLGPLRNLPGLTLAGRDDRDTVTGEGRR